MATGLKEADAASDDFRTKARGAFVWKMSTRNHWVLSVDGITVGAAVRSPRWKKYGHTRPWYLEIFGSRFGHGLGSEGFEFLDDAQEAVQSELIKIVGRIAAALPLVEMEALRQVANAARRHYEDGPSPSTNIALGDALRMHAASVRKAKAARG